MTDLMVLERIERNNHLIASKWLDWRYIQGIIKHLNLKKIKSIAEVNGGGECIIAAMALYQKIRIGVLLITELNELQDTYRNCIIALASINKDNLPITIIHKTNKITIKFGISRKLKIIYGNNKGAIGGSDLIICQFPTPDQLLELRGNSYIISHQMADLGHDIQEVHIDDHNEFYNVFHKQKNIKKSIHWGTNDVRIIGPRTGREQELCSRFS